MMNLFSGPLAAPTCQVNNHSIHSNLISWKHRLMCLSWVGTDCGRREGGLRKDRVKVRGTGERIAIG